MTYFKFAAKIPVIPDCYKVLRRREERRVAAVSSNRTLIKSDINIAGQLATLPACVKRRAADMQINYFQTRREKERERREGGRERERDSGYVMLNKQANEVGCDNINVH